VSVNGEPLVSRLTDIGYVPQEEIDHRWLTIYEALTYSARLRLPDDASADEIEARVRQVLEELALTEHAHTRIGSLSGGQRRRASVATELLGRPSLLLLDEPTTGMDPWLESKMMSLLRELADHSRGVALVTHATKSLALCDRVVALTPSGVVAFDGAPSDARGFFGVGEYDSIYPALRSSSATRPRRPAGGDGSDHAAAGARVRATTVRRRRRSAWRQTRILASRYVRLMRRDRRNLLLLLVQPPVLGLAGGGLFTADVFARPGGKVGDAIEVLFLATLVMVWVGSINGAREIIKERGIFNRESALGVRLVAYLSSKLIVLFGLTVIQTLLYAGVLFAFVPLHAPVDIYLGVLALLIATGFVAVTMGLFISAAVNTEDQATTALPLAFIPQLIFAGTIVPVASMAGPAHALANVTFARWSLASSGSVAEMNARMAEATGFSRVTSIGWHFFNVGVVSGLLIQAAFLTTFLAGVFALLRR
jgi:ABC-type multidrug transport system ATPase subunit